MHIYTFSILAYNNNVFDGNKDFLFKAIDENG